MQRLEHGCLQHTLLVLCVATWVSHVKAESFFTPNLKGRRMSVYAAGYEDGAKATKKVFEESDKYGKQSRDGYLFAAAPDMLEALEAFVQPRAKAGRTQVTQQEWDKMQAAIAKAKGKA